MTSLDESQEQRSKLEKQIEAEYRLAQHRTSHWQPGYRLEFRQTLRLNKKQDHIKGYRLGQGFLEEGFIPFLHIATGTQRFIIPGIDLEFKNIMNRRNILQDMTNGTVYTKDNEDIFANVGQKSYELINYQDRPEQNLLYLEWNAKFTIGERTYMETRSPYKILLPHPKISTSAETVAERKRLKDSLKHSSYKREES